MSMYKIHIFISHSWSYSTHYDTLSDWIFTQRWSFGQASLSFRDYSVLKDDPIHNAKNTTSLTNAIHAKIARSHIIVIPLGMYANYSKWIRKEIIGAKKYSKPILGVNPWAQQRQSSVVSQSAQETVGWNKKSVIDSIWKLYYHDYK